MRTWSFPSKSNAFQSHTVTLHDDGRLICSCRGFRSPNKCWHIEDVGKQLVADFSGIISPKKITLVPATPLKQESLLGQMPPIPIKPMLASGLKDGQILDDYTMADYVLEEKYDGHRLIIEVGQEITAWSRAGNIRVLSRNVHESLTKIAPGIYDGELCIPGGTSTDVVSLDLVAKSQLVLFDILRVSNHSTLELPWSERRKLLEAAVPLAHATLFLSEVLDVSHDAVQAIWNRGGEGAILKKINSLYEERRSKSWLKIKQELTVEATIVGFIPGLLGPHSKIALVDDHGKEIHVKAKNDHWRHVFSTKADKFIGKRIRIQYALKTKTGKYQQPRAADEWIFDHILED